MPLPDVLATVAGELILVPVTLLPIINPLSTASIFVSTVGGRRDVAKRLARQIAVNSFVVIVVAMLVGTYVLSLFGISLPVVRIGGGLLVAAAGWRMLGARVDDPPSAAEAQASAMVGHELQQKSFFPLTFPLTTGPGTIAACITLGTHVESVTPLHLLSGVVVAVGGAMLVVAVIYLILRNSIVLVTRLGPTGAVVMQQLVAFVLLCIGIQLMWAGWVDLNHETFAAAA
ncbi:antibiotic resistance protein MarC [Stenotrophomonas sp. ESTM1D_MKCIP4_1]|uniref:MarC family protein n=1 Tax=Stenotrophomonas sp. ESTM1D_MKCIP4_1 TaxID=2072414 RepID=UPI000D53F5FA|nr:MarC family protein [Stenotrophomonas sp. ESTM1D_MKCIP4_1]AWH53289.1 antibiotic resistance protein MarC [Stenotrophomonas sp. ESTM1D_MKCIP4_1]